jgi:phosphoglycerol transferase MdoB-like AlkP superfamily enzyme
MFYRPSKLTKFLLLVSVLNLILFSSLRFAFWFIFRGTDTPIPIDMLLKSFFIGFKMDLRLALLLALPIVLASLISKFNPVSSHRARNFWPAHLCLLILLTLLFYITDFGNFAYLQERIDISALRFLENPLISGMMVWESYPVVQVTIGLIIFGIAYYFILKLLMSKCMQGKTGHPSGWKKIPILFLGIVLYFFGIYGNLTHYPLRWCDAFFSTHRFCSTMTLNPVLYFFDTLFYASERFDPDKTKKYYDVVSTYIGVDEPNKESLNFTRRVRPTPVANENTNIIIILLESFSVHETGNFGNPLNPSPNFDSIAKDALCYKRFYTPRSGTARAVFAALTGIPDVVQKKTASRKPAIVNQHMIMNSFSGHEKFYFLGGSANWANIRGLFAHNIDGLRIYEEGSYNSKRIDTWGIDDLHLFEEANLVLRGVKEKPFFAFIHTSGNHRPYNIPKDNRGFKKVNIAEEKLKEYGFSSLAEFNSFRYLDHSLGFFINLAKKEKYFRNTLFFVFGDNGVRGKAPHMVKAEEVFQLLHYHVPFLIYGPGLIPKGKVINTIASQIDLMPTIAGITATPALNTTLGRNLFDKRFNSQSYAFIESRRGPIPVIGLLSSDFYLKMNADGSEIKLHEYYSDTPETDVGVQFLNQKKKMARLCQGFFETSKYMMYNNKPLPHSESKL